MLPQVPPTRGAVARRSSWAAHRAEKTGADSTATNALRGPEVMDTPEPRLTSAPPSPGRRSTADVDLWLRRRSV